MRNGGYPVFVPFETINEDEMEHGDLIEWCYENLKPGSKNALYLSEDEVYLLQYHSKILDIINDESGGMLQAGEDDWIISEEIKRNVIEKLERYEPEENDIRVKELLKEIMRLLNLSLRTGRNIYFIF